MTKKLHEIAEILTGFSFRNKIEEDLSANTYVLQIKDIDLNDNINIETVVSSSIDVVNAKYYMNSNDILFKSRGANFRASFVKVGAHNDKQVIVAAPLIIIRVDTSKVEPAYVSWYMNKTSSQLYFDKEAKGTGIRMISKKTLDDLEVIVPSLEKQRQIVSMQELIEREMELMKILTQKRKILLEGVLMAE